MSNSSKISLVIPAYYASKELEEMTQRCMDSIGLGIDQIILQVDELGEGYSKTTNKALKNCTGDIIIVGNNDLVFHDNWLTELLFPLQVGFDLSTCWTSDQNFISLEDRIESGGKFSALFAMKRIIYDTIGGFDEQFKGYFADTDYRQRLLEKDFTIGKNMNMVVDHLAKATYKVVDKEDEEFIRARILYEIKWGEVH
jgi:hypothetical protein